MTPAPIWTSGSVLYRWTSCTPNPAAEARAALRRVLGALGMDGDAVSDVTLAVSELVANAAEHACGPYEVRLRCTADEFVCEVRDGDPTIPEVPARPVAASFEPDPELRGGGLEALCELLGERGRGLHIVHQLTRGAWGFKVSDTSKAAWVAFGGPGAPNRP